MQDATVVVAGAGPAGLVAARRLADRGAEVRLVERRSAVGGRVRSEHTDGFVFDRGFQVLFTAYPAARRELDFDALALRRFAPGAVVCRPGHRAVLADPLRDPGALVETALSPDATLGDKVRVLRLRRDLARTPAEDIWSRPDQPIDDYLAARGFSGRFRDRFVAPFYGGITLDRSLSTSSRVFEFTFKMLVEGDAAVPADGMGAVTRQLADAARDAGAQIETGREVTAVDSDGPAVAVGGETVGADAVVVATDPPTARELTGVDAVPTAGRGCVTQYYRFPESFDPGTGRRLLLNAGGERPNQVAPLSAVAPEYAPSDATLLSATFLGGPDADDDALAADTTDALRSWFPERRVPDPEVVHTDRVPFAQFDQPPGVHETLPDVRAPEGAVYLAGEFTRASSINAAMESGRAAARAVAGDLQT